MSVESFGSEAMTSVETFGREKDVTADFFTAGGCWTLKFSAAEGWLMTVEEFGG